MRACVHACGRYRHECLLPFSSPVLTTGRPAVVSSPASSSAALLRTLRLAKVPGFLEQPPDRQYSAGGQSLSVAHFFMISGEIVVSLRKADIFREEDGE